MRSAFEAWAAGLGYSLDPVNPIATGGRFRCVDTQAVWEAWQATCVFNARVLDALADDADPDDFSSIALREAAKEIRGETD